MFPPIFNLHTNHFQTRTILKDIQMASIYKFYKL